jgi:hypothetical protein
VQCRRCSIHSLIDLSAVNDVRQRPNTPIWKLDGSRPMASFHTIIRIAVKGNDVNGEPLSWRIATVRAEMLDLGSAVRQLHRSGLDSATAQLLLTRKRAELEVLMKQERRGHTKKGTPSLRCPRC